MAEGMGQGSPIFHYPAYVVQTVLPSEAPLYTQQEVLILHSKYLGRAWVNQALVDEGDDGCEQRYTAIGV